MARTAAGRVRRQEWILRRPTAPILDPGPSSSAASVLTRARPGWPVRRVLVVVGSPVPTLRRHGLESSPPQDVPLPKSTPSLGLWRRLGAGNTSGTHVLRWNKRPAWLRTTGVPRRGGLLRLIFEEDRSGIATCLKTVKTDPLISVEDCENFP